MSIRLSPKHGVNPSIPVCFYCTQPKNEIILAGRMKDDTEAPHNAVWDMVPCDECKGFMQQGVILISAKDGDSRNNPHRTGGWAVLREDAVRRLINDPKKLSEVLTRRVCFVEDKTWKAIGLPEYGPQQ